ncbi:MAG: phage tail assembly chaperone [Anaerotignum faecicola]
MANGFERLFEGKQRISRKQRVHISPCFRENGEEVLWELRAVSEEEYRRAAEGKRDKWAVLCMLSVVVPDLTDKALRESYGADSGEAALQEMLYPGEYMRLLEAVKDINGFQSRRRVWKEQAKK